MHLCNTQPHSTSRPLLNSTLIHNKSTVDIPDSSRTNIRSIINYQSRYKLWFVVVRLMRTTAFFAECAFVSSVSSVLCACVRRIVQFQSKNKNPEDDRNINIMLITVRANLYGHRSISKKKRTEKKSSMVMWKGNCNVRKKFCEQGAIKWL